MKYEQTNLTSRDCFKDMGNRVEYIYRDMAQRIISNMAIEDLKRLFSFTEINPLSERSDEILRDYRAPDSLKFKIQHLKEIHAIEHKAEITT